MCDVNPDKLEAEEQLMKRKQKIIGSTCMKCKAENAVVVIRVQDPMCSSCFLTYVTHKFRSTLGKSKLVQPNDKVLLALSGGHASTALLHLVRGALSLGAHKRLKFSPSIVCVDESETLPHGQSQDYSHIEELAKQFGYPFHMLPIYNGFSKENDSVENCNGISSDDHLYNGNGPREEDRLKFRECFRSISSLTGQQDFLATRRMWVISQFAGTHEYKKVMVGDTSTSLCMKLIANISLGRGNTVPLDLGVADRRYPGFTIIRPLREIASKEVALFNRLSEIKVELPCNIITMKDSGSSLQQKTEEFINGLQTDFPHTVNTVFRTGDKVCSTSNPKDDHQVCPMCYSPLKPTNQNAGSVVTNGVCKENGGGCCGTSDECQSSRFTLSSDDVRGQLCYACELTFRDMDYNVEVLPWNVLQHTTEQVRRDKMKDSIKEFLLD